jgi:hypothetical protein
MGLPAGQRSGGAGHKLRAVGSSRNSLFQQLVWRYRAQILKGGYSKWCHVLSASAERLPSATTEAQPFDPLPTQEKGLTKETNDFLLDLLKNAPTAPP